MSQASRWGRARPEVSRSLGPKDGSDEDGYISNSMRRRSAISWRVATSPGFLSEYNSATSCTKGVGHELRNAKQPIEDVDRALKHRRSSCKTWSSCCSSLERTVNVSLDLCLNN